VCQIYTVTELSIFLCSFVILELAPAHGPVVMVWHVTIIIHARVQTCVAMVYALARFFIVTHSVKTVMATAALRKQDLDS